MTPGCMRASGLFYAGILIRASAVTTTKVAMGAGFFYGFCAFFGAGVVDEHEIIAMTIMEVSPGARIAPGRPSSAARSEEWQAFD
jgi:hypothetical protein